MDVLLEQACIGYAWVRQQPLVGLTAADFHEAGLRACYQAMQATPPAQWTPTALGLEPEALESCVAATFQAGSAEAVVEAVVVSSLTAKTQAALAKASAVLGGQTHPLDTTLADLRATLAHVNSRLILRDTSLKSFKTYLPALVDAAYAAAEATRVNGGPCGQALTGFEPLDEVSGGIEAGHLVMLGGLPGAGKTSFLLSLMYYNFLAGHQVAFYSLEMTWQTILRQLLQAHSRIQARAVRLGQLDDAMLVQFSLAAQTLHDLQGDIQLSVERNMNIDRLAEEVKGLERRPAWVLTDYIGRLVQDERNERHELTQIAWGHKQLAEEVGCAALLLSQFGRAFMERGTGVPRESDFAGSQGQEAAADYAWGLVDPQQHGLLEDIPGALKLWRIKDRHNPIGDQSFIYLMRDEETNLLDCPPVRRVDLEGYDG